MGQYYKAIFLNEKKNRPVNWVQCYDFGSGAKLMEHSWLKNDFVRFVEKQLMKEPRNLVWAGDYADNETDVTEKELLPFVDNTSEYWTLEKLKKDGVNLYTLADDSGKITHDEEVKDKYNHSFKNVAPLTVKYLINFDKKEFVDKSKVPDTGDGWKIHPLPLLTCEGNGRGGGDYGRFGEDKNKTIDYIGRWSRDKIGVASRKSDIPKDFKEIKPDFTE